MFSFQELPLVFSANIERLALALNILDAGDPGSTAFVETVRFRIVRDLARVLPHLLGFTICAPHFLHFSTCLLAVVQRCIFPHFWQIE